MLSVEALSVSLGSSEILRGIDLTVPAGGLVCVVGANGAGKTTLLRAVMGYLRPSAGRVTFAGQDVTGWAPHRLARAGMGYSPEGSGVFASLSVEENIRVATWAQPDRGDPEERVALARSVFPALEAYWGRQGAKLSGGERKMLSVARALAAGPDLLILDEPFEGLSPAVLPAVATAIAAVAARGCSILIAESAPRHIPAGASAVLRLERGEITG